MHGKEIDECNQIRVETTWHVQINKASREGAGHDDRRYPRIRRGHAA